LLLVEPPDPGSGRVVHIHQRVVRRPIVQDHRALPMVGGGDLRILVLENAFVQVGAVRRTELAAVGQPPLE
jgi:hypothetical protein